VASGFHGKGDQEEKGNNDQDRRFQRTERRGDKPIPKHASRHGINDPLELTRSEKKQGFPMPGEASSFLGESPEGAQENSLRP